MKTDKQKPDRYERFVDAAFKIAQNDKAASAKLRRADNPDTASQSWDILIRLGVDITKVEEMRAFSLIASAICKTKASKDGEHSLGRALYNTLKESADKDNSPIRLRRLLACTQQEELCVMLRPLLQMIIAKNGTDTSPLHFTQLLKDVRWFGYSDESTLRIRLSWADGYHNKAEQK